MKLQDAIVGRAVVYTPFKNCPPNLLEDGIITSVGSKFVFVRYRGDLHSKSTYPEDIEYVTDGKSVIHHG